MLIQLIGAALAAQSSIDFGKYARQNGIVKAVGYGAVSLAGFYGLAYVVSTGVMWGSAYLLATAFGQSTRIG
jgi:hypothetical protein